MIAHHNEMGTRQELAKTPMRKKYGDSIANAFDFWWQNGMAMKLIDCDYMRLLPKGEAIAARWQDIATKLYAV